MPREPRTHTVRVEPVPNGRETDYLAICSCGWEGSQTHDAYRAITTRCAVLEAEMEGDLRAQARRQRQELGTHAA